jgi:hypothetical protein
MGEEWFAKAKFHELEAQLSALQSDNDTLRAEVERLTALLEESAERQGGA